MSVHENHTGVLTGDATGQPANPPSGVNQFVGSGGTIWKKGPSGWQRIGQSSGISPSTLTGQSGAEPSSDAFVPNTVSQADTGPDFGKMVEDLLGSIQQGGFDRSVALQQQFMEKGLSIDPNVLTESENTQLQAIKDSLSRTSDRDRERAISVLTARGMGRSSNIRETFEEFSEILLLGQAQAGVGFRQASADRKTRSREHFLNLATQLEDTIARGRTDQARLILDAYNMAAQRELDRELSTDQIQLEREFFDENMMFQRTKFTEEQRENLRRAGYTDREITISEQRLAFETEIRWAELQANTDIASRNLDQQFKIQYELAKELENARQALADRSLTLEEFNSQWQQRMAERGISLDELKNNQDQTFRQRAQAWKVQMDISAFDLETDKFEAYAKNLEREFGLNVNRYELAKFIETGNLDLNVLNSQRSYDLNVTAQRQEWLISKARLELQERLGIGDQEIRYALGMGQLSIQREANAIQKWATQLGITLEYDKLEAQVKMERDKAKGGLFGSILKSAVSLGIMAFSPDPMSKVFAAKGLVGG